MLRGGVPGTGDIVSITAFQQPDMTTGARVSDAGTVSFPLVGAVKVQGLTLARAEATMQARSRQVAV